ncbi:MAG: hypothetical protein WDM76_07835 [Limisphaerales bacterium]
MLQATSGKIVERISALQEKLNRLTRGYLDELIEEESYQSAQADLVLEKTALKREKERLHRTRASYWNEPAKEVVNALEMAGKMEVEKISTGDFRKSFASLETNRPDFAQKLFSFSFAESFDLIPSLLASRQVAPVNHLAVASRRKS